MSDHSVRRILLFLLGLLVLGFAVLCAIADYRFAATIDFIWAFCLFAVSVKEIKCEGQE